MQLHEAGEAARQWAALDGVIEHAEAVEAVLQASKEGWWSAVVKARDSDPTVAPQPNQQVGSLIKLLDLLRSLSGHPGQGLTSLFHEGLQSLISGS